MFKRLYISFVIIAATVALSLAGCKGGNQIDPVEPEPEPLLIDTTIVVPPTASVTRFSFLSYSGWKATVTSGAAWCKITPVSGGSGGATVAVKVAENDEFMVRQATIHFENATTTGKITVIQQQIDVLDVNTDDSCDFGPQGGTFGVNIGYNIDYDVSFSAGWVRQIQTKALQHTTLMFEVDKNNSGGDRTCEVTFSGAGLSHTVTVSQIAAYLRLSLNEVSLEADVDRFPIVAESNVSFEASTEEGGWATIQGESSAGSDGIQTSTLFNIALQQNEWWFLRECDVTFGNPDYALESGLHLVQKAVDIMYASLPLFEFGTEGGSFEFDIDPTKEYSFSSGEAQWIKVSTAEDNPARRIITIEKNLTGLARTASLTITRGSVKKTLDFSQKGALPEFSSDRLEFATSGGSQNLTVTGCVEYTLVLPSDAPWCSVKEVEPGLYSVEVSENPTEEARSCELLFKNEEYDVNEAVTVVQSQKDVFVLEPQSFSFGPEGGKAEVSIHANIPYEYTLDSPDWVSEAAGSTSEKRTFLIQPNASGKVRNARLDFTAQGFEQLVAIAQLAAFVTASEHSFAFDDQPGQGSFDVDANVSFKAKVLEGDWLSLKAVSQQNISFELSENNEWGNRTAFVVVYNDDYNAADTVKVFQGAKYYLDIDQTEFDLPPQGGTVALKVTSNKDYQYHIDGAPDWISETSSLVFDIQPNTTNQAREVRIVFEQNGKSKSVNIYQDAPVLIVQPSRLEFTAAGGEASFTVTSNIDFAVGQVSADWAQMSAVTASSYTVSVALNELPEDRSCTVEVSSVEFSRNVSLEINQAAKGVFELLTDSFTLGPEGGEINVEVNTNVDYTTAVSEEWVTGEGLDFNVARNLSGAERSCTIEYTADGFKYYVTVTQSEAYVNVDKEQLDLPVNGGQRSFRVAANVPFEVVVPDLEWVSCSPAEDNVYDVSVSMNDGTDSRECTIQVVSTEYEITRDVIVLQERSDFFELTSTSFELGPEGGEIEILLRTNVDYECSVSDDWITPATDLKFNVEKNASGEVREGTISFEAMEQTFQVSISQTPAYLTVSESAISVDQPGGSFTITAQGNVPFVLEMPQSDWISGGEPSEAGEYTFEVAEKTDTGVRTCYLTFSAGDYGLSESVKVTQKGIPDPFSIPVKEYFIGPCGGDVEVKHTECSDVSTYANGATWIRELPARRNDTLLVFNLDTLFTEATRQAAVSVVGNGRTQMVYIFQNPPQLMLLDESKTVKPQGGVVSAKFTGNFTPDFYTDAEWVQCSVSDDGEQLLFNVSPNESGLERTAIIEVGLRRLNCTETFTLTQKPLDMIRVTPDQYGISGDGGEFFITVEANVQYNIDVRAQWISCTPTEEENVYRIEVEPNSSVNARSSTIAFTGMSAMAYLRINQDGHRNPDYYYSEDYSRDGNVTRLQRATEGAGIPVIIMGDAFTDRLIADGTYAAVMNRAAEALFSIEPFTSFRNMFDVYSIDVVSANEVYADDAVTALSTHFESGQNVTGNDDTVYERASKIIEGNKAYNMLVIVILNLEAYGGTTYLTFYTEDGVDYGVGEAISYLPLCTSEEEFAMVLKHEAGGHGFGKLHDEYYYKSNGEIPASLKNDIKNKQTRGYYKNVDFTSDPTQVRWAYFIEDERYQYDGLGVFEGACSYYTGAFRPTQESVMYHGEGPFNAPSREAIYYRMHKLANGKNWTYSREDFIEYDAINRRTSPGASQSSAGHRASVLESRPPLPPPVIVTKSKH